MKTKLQSFFYIGHLFPVSKRLHLLPVLAMDKCLRNSCKFLLRRESDALPSPFSDSKTNFHDKFFYIRSKHFLGSSSKDFQSLPGDLFLLAIAAIAPDRPCHYVRKIQCEIETQEDPFVWQNSLLYHWNFCFVQNLDFLNENNSNRYQKMTSPRFA